MKTIQFSLSLLLIAISLTSYGQNDPTSNPILTEAFLTSDKGFRTNESPKNLKENSVFIQQVGSDHIAVSNVVSKISAINFLQEGTGNYINLKANVNSIVENVVQKGGYNNIFDDIYAPESNISLNLIQNGQNNHFERYGSNSIGDKLEFTMNSSDTSIIVRNFK